MSKAKRTTIEVQGTAIGILSQPDGDYISLTDMVRNFDGAGTLIEQWLKNKDTVLFLGVWERINNPGFNSLEFEGISGCELPLKASTLDASGFGHPMMGEARRFVREDSTSAPINPPSVLRGASPMDLRV